MKFYDNNNDGVFSYFGEDENELNDNFEKLMSENKKPIYNSNDSESIFTSQASFKKYSNIKNLHVVNKNEDLQNQDDEQNFDNEVGYDDFSFEQNNYLDDFDVIDEKEGSYEDIKNDISKTTQSQLEGLNKYAKTNYNNSLDMDNNDIKSYSQIPSYAPKTSLTKSNKENHRNSLVNDIVNRHKNNLYTQDISSTSKQKHDSGIKSIPLRDLTNELSHFESVKNNEVVKQDDNSNINIRAEKNNKQENKPVHTHNKNKKSQEPKVTQKEPRATKKSAKVLEFSRESKIKSVKNTAEPIKATKNNIQDQSVEGFNSNIKVKMPSKKTVSNKADKTKKSTDKMSIVPKIVAAVMGLIIIFGLCFYFFIGIEVKQVSVIGQSDYDQSDIILASGIEVTDNILRISTSKLEEQLVKQLPYLSEVEILKSLSDGITIEIISTTSDKILIQTTDSIYFSVDENLKVLSMGESDIEDTYMFVGLGSLDVVLGDIISVDSQEEELKIEIILQLITQFDLSNINADFYVDLSDSSDVFIIYNDLIEIRLGEVLYPENVIDAFEAINTYEEGVSGYINAYSYKNLTVNLK